MSRRRNDQPHWVGDGFPVRSIFSYHDSGASLSPFLLMDYAGPAQFEPTDQIRGVGEHPHRGFETVSIVYEGEVEHRDSSGGGGVIQPGDVQWMTAAAGIVHEEMHSAQYARTGGPFEMIQLWVNLPKKDKMAPPKYQSLIRDQIPVITLSKGKLRVIAGECRGTLGPASTFSEINLWDIRMEAGAEEVFSVPAGHTAAVFVLNGSASVGGESILPAEVAVLEPSGSEFQIRTREDSKILFLGGAPISEPIVGYGPFVMNTREEIYQAIADYQNGKMGRLPNTPKAST